MKYLPLIACMLMCLLACSKKVTQEELIEAALALKLEQWHKTQLDQCKEKAMMRAEAYVDSFLLANSLETTFDTLTGTEKPIKPSKPVFKQKPDSLVLKEVLPDTIK